MQTTLRIDGANCPICFNEAPCIHQRVAHQAACDTPPARSDLNNIKPSMRESPRPDPTGDLDSDDEIAEMVRRFYADVTQDDLLGPMFNEVARVDWNEHLPKLTAFWCRALLGQPGYQGNPFRAHMLVHAQREFTPAHFDRWLTLFHETIELGWTGPNARRAHDLADNVARVHSHQLLGRAVPLDLTAST